MTNQTFGHGGARRGAGRKPKASAPTAPAIPAQPRAKSGYDYSEEKAKLEHHKANLAELEYRKRAGELLERSHVQTAAARLHSFLAQSLRTLPDQMERRCGLTPAQVQHAQDFIDELTEDIRTRLAQF